MRWDVPGWLIKWVQRPQPERISGGWAGELGRKPTFREFLETGIGTDAGMFTFAGREALIEVAGHLDETLRRELPEQTLSILKGTQIGMTTLAIGLALYCVHVRRLNVGYFLPDQDFANRFGGTRIRPAIRSPSVM